MNSSQVQYIQRAAAVEAAAGARRAGTLLNARPGSDARRLFDLRPDLKAVMHELRRLCLHDMNQWTKAAKA